MMKEIQSIRALLEISMMDIRPDFIQGGLNVSIIDCNSPYFVV